MLTDEELFKLAADNGVGMLDIMYNTSVVPMTAEDEDYHIYLSAYRAIESAARRDALEEALDLVDSFAMNNEDLALAICAMIDKG